MKGQKNKILAGPDSRHSCGPMIFYFLPTTNFLKQFPTHIAHPDHFVTKAAQNNTSTEALSKVATIQPKIFKLEIFIN